ncbi:DUF3592 domain-containing protein [Streptomyces sp. Q6]|uniref:DUF3592 domain-containing protein n=1 Tax=Streptomyces citrinus TaxID=3118173 RepID=A0ACD5AI62_9ACTN
MAAFALAVLYAAVRIFRRGRALRTRGIRVSAACVNEDNSSKGGTFLQVQFPVEDRELVTSVGPFSFPPARRGESLTVVYDPQDPTNIETPEQMSSGKLAIGFMGFACVLLALAALMFITA